MYGGYLGSNVRNWARFLYKKLVYLSDLLHFKICNLNCIFNIDIFCVYPLEGSVRPITKNCAIMPFL